MRWLEAEEYADEMQGDVPPAWIGWVLLLVAVVFVGSIGYLVAQIIDHTLRRGGR